MRDGPPAEETAGTLLVVEDAWEGGPSISSCLVDGDTVVDAEQQAVSNRVPTSKKERLIRTKFTLGI
jgi:hypothetical protein